MLFIQSGQMILGEKKKGVFSCCRVFFLLSDMKLNSCLLTKRRRRVFFQVFFFSQRQTVLEEQQR